MSVVFQKIAGRSGSISIKNERQYQDTWLGVSDDPGDDQPTVLSAFINSVHGVGITHPTDPTALCTRIACNSAEDDDLNWIISVSWGMEQWSEIAAGGVSPLLIPAVLSGNLQHDGERVISHSIHDEPIVARSGMPFADPPTIDTWSGAFSISKNLASEPTWAEQYVRSVNASTFKGRDRQTVRFVGVQYSREVDQVNGVYWPSTFQFLYRPDGWKYEPLNRSFHAWTGEMDDDGQRIITDIDPATGTQRTEPVLLDQQGKVLPEGQTPIFLEFEVYHPLPYNVFEFN